VQAEFFRYHISLALLLVGGLRRIWKLRVDDRAAPLLSHRRQKGLYHSDTLPACADHQLRTASFPLFSLMPFVICASAAVPLTRYFRSYRIASAAIFLGTVAHINQFERSSVSVFACFGDCPRLARFFPSRPSKNVIPPTGHALSSTRDRSPYTAPLGHNWAAAFFFIVYSD
jgi:hypothetical protein